MRPIADHFTLISNSPYPKSRSAAAWTHLDLDQLTIRGLACAHQDCVS